MNHIVAEQIDLVVSDRANFPWTKFYTLLRRPEVYGTQLEDGYPPVETMDFRGYEHDPCAQVWLVMHGERTLGFVLAKQTGQVRKELHVGFRAHVEGWLKKGAIAGVVELLFRAGVRQITATIPEQNKAARYLAVAIGMRRVGRLEKSFLRDGQLWDHVVYGINN